MRGMKIGVLALSLALIVGQAVQADPLARADDADKQVEREFKEGLEKILRAFDLMLRSVPQYAAPEVLENGDIVIRRKPPRPPTKQKEGSPPGGGEWT